MDNTLNRVDTGDVTPNYNWMDYCCVSGGPSLGTDPKKQLSDNPIKGTGPSITQKISMAHGGNTNCSINTSKYDCEQSGCMWDFNDNYCH